MRPAHWRFTERRFELMFCQEDVTDSRGRTNLQEGQEFRRQVPPANRFLILVGLDYHPYRASVREDGCGVTSETITIKAQEMIVIGTTGSSPNHASAPGTRAV
jgi:hypothetical protein